MSLRFAHLVFEWKAINILSELPKLKVLRLSACLGCIGEEWELLEKENFDQLIVLEIALTYLKHWEASACHFPNLRHLVLKGCLELVEIPADFADIAELKSIKLDCCLPSAVDSAKEIQKEQHEYGNDNMVVIEEDTIVDDYSSELRRRPVTLESILKLAIWCIDSPVKHFAEVVRASVLGLGTNEDSLTRAIVSRAEIDLAEVRGEYEKITTSSSLDQAVADDTSGDYKDFLMALLGAEV
nr:putative late blight resistance protein homolog R1A-3 [Ipomoea batatas]